METLLRIFGWPHELLHVLALGLIGRRAARVTQAHVDIPADLSTREYVFVAGLPALVFWLALALSVIWLINAPDILRILIGLALVFICGLAALGTVGDLHLIIERLLAEQKPPDHTE